MSIRTPGVSRFLLIINCILALWLGMVFAGAPSPVHADSNDPTATSTPTATVAVTLPPTDTPLPTIEPTQEENAAQEDTTAKGVDVSQGDSAAQSSMEESGPKPWTDSLRLIDLVLLAAIVLVTIAVMILVVYGIIQRLG